jgi:hypothetical protein
MTLAVSIAQSGANNVTMRNRIINGNMNIDQRNNGASVSTPTNKQYCLDRWAFWFNGGGGSAAATVQQSSVAPAGFVNSIAITQAASYSPTSANYNVFAQYIEGYNVADFGWGTANAQPVTLSFWVRSSLTGTFGGAISNGGQTRSYPFTYTINSANTFEFKTITIPGDTAGTWLTTTATGMQLYWQLGVGSTYLGTAGAWAGAAYLGATGATQITATNGATFYITGVQLEKGTTATAFEQRLYGTELALCQRYAWIASPSVSGNSTYTGGVATGGSSGAAGLVVVPMPVQMRANPSLTVSGTSFYCDNYALAGSAPSGNVSLQQASINSCRVQLLNITVSGGSFAQKEAFNIIIGSSSTTGTLLFSAEL